MHNNTVNEIDLRGGSADMSTGINLVSHGGELRILDTDLAMRLGFERPRDIRKLIKRYEADLVKMGTCATVARVIRGNETEVYYLNKKQAIFITAKAETVEATEVTIEIIEKFDAYERGLVSRNDTPAVPKTFREALLLAADQQEQIERQQAQIEQDAPKVAALAMITEKEGDLGIRDTGRELGVGQNAVREMILAKGWACIQGKDPRPAYYGLKHGYTRLVARPYTDRVTGQEKVTDDFKITRKGITRLAEIIAAEKGN